MGPSHSTEDDGLYNYHVRIPAFARSQDVPELLRWLILDVYENKVERGQDTEANHEVTEKPEDPYLSDPKVHDKEAR